MYKIYIYRYILYIVIDCLNLYININIYSEVDKSYNVNKTNSNLLFLILKKINFIFYLIKSYYNIIFYLLI